jgi:ketosteroid isomerase-like protein
VASAELSRRAEKVVSYPPLSKMDQHQRRDLPGKWQAAIVTAEQNRPPLRVVTAPEVPPGIWLQAGASLPLLPERSSPRDTGRAMSQEKVETVQRAVEAWNADDLDAFLAELDADIEWHPAIQPGLEGKATTYRGHDGARKIWRQDRGEAWERLTNRPQEFRDLGESVLALGHMDLSARATGIEFSQELGEVFDFRAGKIVRIRDFLTHAEALEAAGLRE